MDEILQQSDKATIVIGYSDVGFNVTIKFVTNKFTMQCQLISGQTAHLLETLAYLIQVFNTFVQHMYIQAGTKKIIQVLYTCKERKRSTK